MNDFREGGAAPFSFKIQTMGCKVNTYDTSLLEKNLTRHGFLQDEENPRIHIINSCAVTEKSSLETHRHVKRLKARHPESTVVITGCVAQVDVGRLTTLSGADLIIGNSHKGDFSKILLDYMENRSSERVFHSNIFKKTELDEGGGIESSRTRAFLKIQDGCNSFCSFCIIPFARGKSRSLKIDHLVSRVRSLHEQGFQEVVLTGVHCGDFEDDALGFSDLVGAVLHETVIPRVRLSSLEPVEIDTKLWDLFSEEKRLCPHIHVSLQSANDKVLGGMGRKYGQKEIAAFFEAFAKKVPGGFIGMDVIVGFPGETAEEFEDTLRFLDDQSAWTRIHVFPYSSRPGTKAAKRTDHLPEKIIRERARDLRALSLARQEVKAKEQLGLLKRILVLEKESHGSQGLSRDYWPVRIVGGGDAGHALEAFKNHEIQVEITGSERFAGGDPILLGRMT